MKKYTTDIQKLYKKLASLKTYAPSKRTNKLFAQLINFALNPKSKNSLGEDEMNKLQIVCSQAEYELEKYWAQKIIKSKNPEKLLNSFPYIENYKKLTRMEWFSLLSCTTHQDHRIVFAGGGPLPLTAFFLASEYSQKVTILDIDPIACDLSRKLIKKLKMDNKIAIVNSDASEYSQYGNFNVIIVAALAGLEKNTKEKILIKIKEHAPSGSHILARSSWGLREILYHPLDKKVDTIFQPVIEVRPKNDIINSVVIFKNF